MSDNIFQAKVYKSPVAGDVKTADKQLGSSGPVSCQDLVPPWGRGWSAKGSGSGDDGPLQAPSFSREPVSKPAQGEELLPQCLASLKPAKSGKGSDGRSRDWTVVGSRDHKVSEEITHQPPSSQ